MNNSVKIQIRNLNKSFGSKVVLKDINLDVPKSSSLVVLGGSGTGKSVLLKNILGIMKPDSGSVLVDGFEMVGASSSAQSKQLEKFGMLFQGGALFDSLTVWENITFGLRQRQSVSNKDAIEIAESLVKQVGLASETVFLMPAELSGGMQKRVSLARAICTKPEIIFFDEPTAGLDPIMAGLISELIRETVTKLSATAITITHDMACMKKVADNVCLLYGGGIIWSGSGKEVWETDNPYISQFIHGHSTGPIKIAV